MTQIQALLSALNGLRQSTDHPDEDSMMPPSYVNGRLDALDEVEKIAQALAQHEPPDHYTVSVTDNRADGGGVSLILYPVRPQTAGRCRLHGIELPCGFCEENTRLGLHPQPKDQP